MEARLDLDPLLEMRFGEKRFAHLTPSGDLSPEIARILGRRTIRRYTAQPVEAELVDVLIAAALSASSKSDFQQASIIKVLDPEKRQAIGSFFPAMPWIGTSPGFLVFCGDPRRLEQICERHHHPAPQRDIEAFLNASVDAALALQTFILAAEGAGLGCCPISVIRNRVRAIARILELPSGVFPVSGLCFGYPSEPGHVSMRLPPTVTVHADAYDDGSAVADIGDYDARRESRYATPAEKQRNPAKFGYAQSYGWSEDKARQAAEPEGQEFNDYLRETWFRF
jgi:FMN reductase [NAD(P)H]